MQILKTISSVAKKIRIEAKTSADEGSCSKKRIEMTNAIRNPSRAAKIFGALSMGFFGNMRSLARAALAHLTGLNFEKLNARRKKSMVMNSRNQTESKRIPATTNRMTNRAFNLVTCSSIFSSDIGQIKFFMEIYFLANNREHKKEYKVVFYFEEKQKFEKEG